MARLAVYGRLSDKTFGRHRRKDLATAMGDKVSTISTQYGKSAEGTQTLRAKAEPKIFAPPQTPLPGGAGRSKFNQLEMVTTFTYRPSLVRIDAFSSYRGNRPTHTHTQTHTYRQDRLQYTASQLAQSVNMTGHVQSENRHHPAKLLRFVEVSCPVREPGSRACTLNTRFFQLFRGSHG